MLPQDFKFPCMTLCTLIMSWFCGNPSRKTLPFKFLKQINMMDDSTKRVFQKMRAMMDAVIKGVKQVNAWNVQHGTWEVLMALQLYESVIPIFKYPITAGHHIRWNAQMSWRTVYNLYTRKGKKFSMDLGGATGDETGAAENGVATADETGEVAD
jgi:hypothetical protein